MSRRSLFGFDPEPGRPSKDGEERPLEVAEITKKARRELEASFSSVLVTGEVSNFTRAHSGHLYFVLKDSQAQLPCVMWRSAAARLTAPVGDGDAVVARGRLTLYEARGQFQMSVERLDPVGAGDFERRFRALKARYEERGYFDPAAKLPLPMLPRTIGLVTSPRGAAVHDVLRTLYGRFRRAHVVVVPTRVQGPGAAEEIAAAIERAAESERFDVLIVGRGGGSIEDLWAFNEPPVVEAIHACPIPVISAVGHEVDVTLSDLVADHRALTPTAAGEVVVPDLVDLEDDLARARSVMMRALRRRLDEASSRLGAAGRHWALRRPLDLVERERQRLDDLHRRLPVTLLARLERERSRLGAMSPGWTARVLADRLRAATERNDACGRALGAAARRRLEQTGGRLVEAGRVLETLSPLRVLERGYSITFDAETGRAIRSASETHGGQHLRTTLADGDVDSVVPPPTPES